MPRRPRRAVGLGMYVLGAPLLVLGAMMLVASMLAIDPEDEVSRWEWMLPSLLGGVCLIVGTVLLWVDVERRTD